jgi:CubicO group peptidase (beta-lactamase class C family)
VSDRHALLVALSIVVPAASSCGSAATTAAGLAPTTVDRIDSIANAWMLQRSVPGISITIVRDGDVLLARGYGTSDANRPAPVTEETIFDLGSIKKHVTATAVMQLAERGLIDLDDPVQRWVKSIRVPGSTVRLRQMLNQVSGLPEAADSETIERLEFEPGTRWAYSNSNFDRMDDVIEAVDGRSFSEYLSEELAGPLHLSSLTMCVPGLPRSALMARGHTRREGSIVPAEDPCWFRGTTRDLALWVDALFSGKVVSGASLQEMLTPVTLPDGTVREYGFGVLLRPYRELRRISHTGHVEGFASAFGYYMDSQTTIAVAGNSDTLFDPDAIEVAIAGVLFELPRSRQPEYRRGDAGRFAGVYDGGSVWFRVEAKGPDSLELAMQPPRTPGVDFFSTALVRIGPDEFVGADSPDVVVANFTFVPGVEHPVGGRIDAVGIRWDVQRR